MGARGHRSSSRAYSCPLRTRHALLPLPNVNAVASALLVLLLATPTLSRGAGQGQALWRPGRLGGHGADVEEYEDLRQPEDNFGPGSMSLSLDADNDADADVTEAVEAVLWPSSKTRHRREVESPCDRGECKEMPALITEDHGSPFGTAGARIAVPLKRKMMAYNMWRKGKRNFAPGTVLYDEEGTTGHHRIFEPYQQPPAAAAAAAPSYYPGAEPQNKRALIRALYERARPLAAVADADAADTDGADSSAYRPQDKRSPYSQWRKSGRKRGLMTSPLTILWPNRFYGPATGSPNGSDTGSKRVYQDWRKNKRAQIWRDLQRRSAGFKQWRKMG